MEVHHHSHSSHERKNFKSYFWEFLMLFLAVFAGFLAENIREHQVEKARGIQYVRSFYNDLKTDTAEFSELIAIYEDKVKTFSKSNECFDSLSARSYAPCLGDLISKARGFPDMVNADQTLLQLKNAGGLRLLEKSDADSILNYDRQVRLFLKFETTGFQERQYKIREFLYTFLNYKKLISKKGDSKIPYFITNDPEKINQFFVLLNEHAASTKSHLRSLNELYIEASGLINYFKNKYHFD